MVARRKYFATSDINTNVPLMAYINQCARSGINVIVPLMVGNVVLQSA